MFLGVLFIVVFSGIILRIMTSRPYFGAREFIPWFAIGYFFHGLYGFLTPVLIKFEKQKYISAVSFVNMIIMILLNVLFVKAFGYIGVAYAFAIIYFLIFMAFAWKAQQVFPLPWLRAVKIWN
jgi:PST family polysaccharide transporter